MNVLCFYEADDTVIGNQCVFDFYYNITVPPSVHDGGKEIVLANMNKGKTLKCHNQIQNPLTEGSYIKPDRSILCHCSIETEKAYISKDIVSCNAISSPHTVEYTSNMAFLKTFNEIRKRGMKLNHTFPDYPMNANTSKTPCQHFPIYLNESKFKGHIDTLKDLIENFISSFKPVKLTPNQTENFKSVIEEYTEDHSRLSIH